MYRTQLLKKIDRADAFDRFEKHCLSIYNEKEPGELLSIMFQEAVNNAVKHGNKNNPDAIVKIGYLLDENIAMITVHDQALVVDGEIEDCRGLGEGLNFIKSNSDIFFFNTAGNQITILKEISMNKDKYQTPRFETADLKISIFSEKLIIITDIEIYKDKGFLPEDFLKELVERKFLDIKDRRYFVNLSNLKGLNSTDWGTIIKAMSTKQGNPYGIDELHFFNTADSVLTTYKQFGIEKHVRKKGTSVQVFNSDIDNLEQEASNFKEEKEDPELDEFTNFLLRKIEATLS